VSSLRCLQSTATPAQTLSTEVELVLRQTANQLSVIYGQFAYARITNDCQRSKVPSADGSGCGTEPQCPCVGGLRWNSRS